MLHSRNEIPLPDQLPICLRPTNLRHSVIDRHNKVVTQSASHQTSQDSHSGPLRWWESPGAFTPGGETSRREHNGEGEGLVVIPGNSSTDIRCVQGSASADLSPESHISSPGRPRPVKFDFNAASVAGDPSIACPKPLRLSPDSPLLHTSDESRGSNNNKSPGNTRERFSIYKVYWQDPVAKLSPSTIGFLVLISLLVRRVAPASQGEEGGGVRAVVECGRQRGQAETSLLLLRVLLRVWRRCHRRGRGGGAGGSGQFALLRD